MVKLPDEVFQALNNPKAGKVVATVRADSTPHLIQVGSCMAPSPDMIAFGAILMTETGKNMDEAKKAKKKVTILVTNEMKSYQINGLVKDFVTSGPLFDKMNEFLKTIGLKARGVYTVEPTNVWNQSASYIVDRKMA